MIERPWLPLSSLADATVSTTLTGALAAWCETWFAGAAPVTLSIVHAGRPVWASAAVSYRWEVHGRAAALAAGPEAIAKLSSLALAAPLPLPARGERDRIILEEFQRRLFADLAERIERALGIAGAPRAEPTSLDDPWADEETLAVLTAFSDGTEAVRVALPARALVPFRKRSASPRGGKSRLVPLGAAVAATAVPVAVRVGSAVLTLEELRGMAAGDVLLLDRALDEPADLLAADRAFARARLVEAERQIRLTIVSGAL